MNVENENNSTCLKRCERDCKLCANVTNICLRTGKNKIFPALTSEDLKRFFNLEDHGFCILEVKKKEFFKKEGKGYKNAMFLVENNFTNIKFQNLGQEESKGHTGKRNILALTGREVEKPENVLAKGSKDHLKTYYKECDDAIINFLNAKYNCRYEMKGKTLISNTGVLEHQNMHLDSIP